MDTASKRKNEQTIITWLQQNAIPVEHIEAGSGFADLQSLKAILKDVKVVGLGETTHGTHEFFQLKHRLVEFLVTEMDFTVFTIEASFSACLPINDYVLYGKGERASVLTGQWYVVWDTEEMAAMLDWMRAYNQGVPDEKKVRFLGVDINRNGNGRQAVLDYLHKVDPDRFTTTEPLFDALAVVEAKWPRRIDEETEKAMAQLLPPLQDLIDHLTVKKNKFVRGSSLAEFDLALRYTRIMKKWLTSNATGLIPPPQSKWSARSTAMAENLIDLIDQAKPDTKFMIWAHNSHVSLEDLWNRGMTLGSILRKKYVQKYFVFGFEFNQGSFQTRIIQPDRLLGDLKEVTLPPSPVGSFPWYLSRTNMGNLILNLREPAGDVLVEQWLNTPCIVHDASWGYDETLKYYPELIVSKKYDGIIFIESTTVTRPTVNALKTVANRDGL
jgi:erythromycin esterase